MDGILPKEQEKAELDREFKEKLVFLLARKAATSLLMPNLVHTGWVWFRGGRYLRMGWGALIGMFMCMWTGHKHR